MCISGSWFNRSKLAIFEKSWEQHIQSVHYRQTMDGAHQGPQGNSLFMKGKKIALDLYSCRSVAIWGNSG